ncbi:PLP-dependent aminotransferase family protein [Microbispora triticiradicis]|uniref:MocR-like pyridoxine biosynthesis transcription factor PdxR n=1 Tax=Microbispora triticiradicis TaxID=2200763 RepID=UPI001AD7D20F|nr:PLP-dependent aminotransferase family protein [Microbispora triticiradicis]MBO4269492.1 aminotransferase class I/II-fold pyridoxal phosphate-dependent enzyme [Microbispora triticiradicis]
MAVEWSGLTPDVFIRLDRQSPEALGSQLQNALRTAVREGRLQIGERLPSSRKLAVDLGVSRGLVQATYEQLEAEGYLRAFGGSATRVAFRPQATVVTSPEGTPAARMEIDFAPGRPDLNSFPARDWLWACGEATRTASARDMGYGDPRGSIRLREVIASYLRRVRGAFAGADDVVICSGFTQGAALTLAALRAAGTTSVAVEDPGHLDMPVLVRRAGLNPVFIPVDDHGLVVDELARTKATAVVVTPAHQTPTGVVLAPDRRLALLQWAEQVNGVVIEDDYDSEFRYDKQPVGSLQGLAADRVVSIGSVSKSLAPAIRLGWVLASRHLGAWIAEEKHRCDRCSPILDQLALARLIESGRFDRHLRRMRGVYAARRNTLAEAIGEHAPNLVLTGLAAGFHAVARLPEGADEAEIVDAAAQRSVGLQGLGRYRSPNSDGPPGIVFGFGDVNENAIRRGIAAIGDLLRQG